MRALLLGVLLLAGCEPGPGHRCGYIGLIGSNYVSCADGYACYHDQPCDDPDCQGVCLPACSAGCAEGCSCLNTSQAWGVCVATGASSFTAASAKPFACMK